MRIVVIGAGAAGMVAAREAANRSAEVLLLEKNNKTGVKILMSGGTRCNITHDTDARGITSEFGHARRFLQPSVGAFPPNEVIKMFNQAGVATKVEDTGKIFPQSDRALNVRNALHRMAVDAGVKIRLGTAVVGVRKSLEAKTGWQVITESETIECDRLIVTAGGRSWPGCGTTGDAYQWLSSLGHSIVPTRPALVPLVGGFSWTHELSGLALEDSIASVLPTRGKAKPLITRRGAWLFTHFGFSGPTPMDVSGTITAADSLKDVALTLDLVPDVDEATVQSALTDRSRNGGRQKVRSVISQWLPNRLADALVTQVGADQPIAELPRAKQTQFVQMIKRLALPINGTRGFAKAEVTAGGVALSEVNPKTMASRLTDGLFIAGEVLDVDGPIGGFNFQAAFSTGKAAGVAAAREE